MLNLFKCLGIGQIDIEDLVQVNNEILVLSIIIIITATSTLEATTTTTKRPGRVGNFTLDETTEEFTFFVTPEEAPGAVVIGVTGLFIILALLSVLCIIDISSFGQNIKLLKRNTKAFRKCWERKNAEHGGHSQRRGTNVTTL